MAEGMLVQLAQPPVYLALVVVQLTSVYEMHFSKILQQMICSASLVVVAELETGAVVAMVAD